MSHTQRQKQHKTTYLARISAQVGLKILFTFQQSGTHPLNIIAHRSPDSPLTSAHAQHVYSHCHKCLSPTLHYTSVGYIHDIPLHQLFYSNAHCQNKNYESKTRPMTRPRFICSTRDYYAHVPYSSTAIIGPELSGFFLICEQPIALLAG